MRGAGSGFGSCAEFIRGAGRPPRRLLLLQVEQPVDRLPVTEIGVIGEVPEPGEHALRPVDKKIATLFALPVARAWRWFGRARNLSRHESEFVPRLNRFVGFVLGRFALLDLFYLTQSERTFFKANSGHAAAFSLNPSTTE